MKKLLFILTLLTITLQASTEAILKLDTTGHTGFIRDIIVTQDGSEIISASDDKSIRVWDAKTGLEKRKILGQISSVGEIFAIALSSDDKYLAVGGNINSGNNERIRIYNYSTGKLIKVLKSHTNLVYDLSFSKDGRFLISGSPDKTAKIWNVRESFSLKDTIKFHTDSVYAVKIIQKQKRYFALTAGFDKKIALYDMQERKVIKSKTSDYKLQFLANSSKNGGNIAVSGRSKEIVIYDFNLKFIKKIKSETEPVGLAYSKDGKFLIAGGGSIPHNVNIYKTKNYTKKISFKKHTNTTVAVAFLNNDYAISAGGDNSEIYIWDINSAKVKRKIEGVGSRVWSVGITGDRVAWGNEWTANCGKSKLQKSIDLKTLEIIKGEFSESRRISKINGDYRLQHSKGGDYSFDDGVLEIRKNGITKVKIIKSARDGFRHKCYGWYNDFIISAGSGRGLIIYNKKGKVIASLIGHSGEVWSIALDGDKLVSGSSDQSIKVWDLSKLGKKKVIHPMLNLFISKENEFVVWTKEGFFNASKKGAKHIGYHINQGANKEAGYVSVDKLYDTFYRPDLVEKALNGEDISSYTKYINIEKLLDAGLAPIVAINTKSFKSKKRDINLKLEVCKLNGGYNNLTLYLNGMAVDVISKDRALKRKKVSKVKGGCFSFEKLISLSNGRNIIGFKATNRAGNIESNLDSIKVDYRGRSNKKPNLYILVIGVDKYRDGDLWLNYSKADAKVFTETIANVSKSLFKNIYSYKLLDKEVTKKNILKTFDKIGAKTSREDVFMLYVAGHGITDVKTGAYFYLPVDFRYKNENSVREKGLSQNNFKLALSKIKAMKSLTILDTCNSGSFAEAMVSRGVLQKTAVNKLTRATGRAIIVASSKDQVALEGYKGHGVFTYTLVEALRGKGYGKDNKITIKELAAYIEDILPERTYKKWGYEQVPQSNITGNDFPIGVR